MLFVCNLYESDSKASNHFWLQWKNKTTRVIIPRALWSKVFEGALKMHSWNHYNFCQFGMDSLITKFLFTSCSPVHTEDWCFEWIFQQEGHLLTRWHEPGLITHAVIWQQQLHKFNWVDWLAYWSLSSFSTKSLFNKNSSLHLSWLTLNHTPTQKYYTHVSTHVSTLSWPLVRARLCTFLPGTFTIWQDLWRVSDLRSILLFQIFLIVTPPCQSCRGHINLANYFSHRPCKWVDLGILQLDLSGWVEIAI